MKQKLLTLALMLGLSISSIFANDNEDVNYRASSSFKKEFAQAQDVRWSNGKGYTKASFKLNDQAMVAYYNVEGELLGVTRNITVSQLPINLLADVKKNHATAWISDLFEITANGETSYYATVETAEQKLVLKSIGTYRWSTFKKEKKNI